MAAVVCMALLHLAGEVVTAPTAFEALGHRCEHRKRLSLRERSFCLLQNPMILLGRFQVAIESVEPSVENMLKQTGPLSTHDGIALNGLEVSIGRIAGEHFDQPFAFRIGSVAVGVDLSG